MKSLGIVRKLDDLGRIVIPIELRRTLDLEEKDPLEIYSDGGKIILRKYQPGCSNCGFPKVVVGLGSVKLCEKCMDKLNKLNKLSQVKGA